MKNEIEKNGYIKDGWFYHLCGSKLFKVTDDMIKVKTPEYCKHCKEEIIVTIFNGEIIETKNPTFKRGDKMSI